ncbi:hypothetical protein RB195_025468 [Necator americanus]|uniref:NR LBD domain-containing protein n=1 Tax=Necator americanus TaxID=51031 RepID=A0ABR1EUR0_NECAM
MSFDGFSTHSPSSSHVSSSFYDFSSLSDHSSDYRSTQISTSPQLICVKTEKPSPPQAWAPPNYSSYEAQTLYSPSLANSVSDEGNNFTYRQFKEEPTYFAERTVFPTASDYQVHRTFPDNNLSHNDRTSPQPPVGLLVPAGGKALLVCKVCGDKASGYHYGVTSCEGCKVSEIPVDFFLLRNSSNMLTVRFGRVPKRSTKEVIDVDTSDSDEKQEVSSTTSPEPSKTELNQLIQMVYVAHEEFAAMTIKRRHILSEHPLDFLLADTSLTTQLRAWEIYTERVTLDIHKTVEFAKRVPGFPSLHSGDQQALIKSSFFRMFLLRIYRGLSSRGLLLADGTFLPSSFLNMIFGQFLNELNAFAQSISTLSVSDEVVAVFVAILLTTKENIYYHSKIEVDRIQNKLVSAMKLKLSEESPDPVIFDLLMSKICYLRELATHHDKIHDVLRYNLSIVKIPALYSEIYYLEHR